MDLSQHKYIEKMLKKAEVPIHDLFAGRHHFSGKLAECILWQQNITVDGRTL